MNTFGKTPLANDVLSSKFELLSEKLIKPSSPTPLHLKSYKISHLDQLTIGSYTSYAIFYPKSSFNRDTNSQLSQVLANSISETLSSYYPLAGTLLDDMTTVDCNDSGASFSEVLIKCPMSEIMAKPDPIAEDLLFPNGLRWECEKRDRLIYIQLSHFACGGKAIGICISHKVCDGCSFTNFLGDWADITRGLKPDPPQFNGSTLLPPVNDPPDLASRYLTKEPVINKRYLFTPNSLSRLKAQVAADSEVKNPSRVEVVAALLYKCSMAATTASSGGVFKPSNLIHVVNLRQVTSPKISPKTVGNIYYYLDISIANEEEMKIPRLVSELRRVKTELFERCRGLKPSELLPIALETHEKMKHLTDNDVYLSSSFVRYPWWLDFGWGKPVKAIFPCLDFKNFLLQMESHDGLGIQVQVTLDDKVMPNFEKEEEILTFGEEIF